MVRATPGVRGISAPMVGGFWFRPGSTSPISVTTDTTSAAPARRLKMRLMPVRASHRSSACTHTPAMLAATASSGPPPNITPAQAQPMPQARICFQSSSSGRCLISSRRQRAWARLTRPAAAWRESSFTAATRVRFTEELGTLRTPPGRLCSSGTAITPLVST